MVLNQSVHPDVEEEFKKLILSKSFWKVVYLKIQKFSASLVSLLIQQDSCSFEKSYGGVRKISRFSCERYFGVIRDSPVLHSENLSQKFRKHANKTFFEPYNFSEKVCYQANKTISSVSCLIHMKCFIYMALSFLREIV